MSEAPQGKRLTGRIIRLAGTWDKGFGFLQTLDGTEYFMHKNNCRVQREFGTFVEHEILTFAWTASPKGPKALDVTRASVLEERDYVEAEQATTDDHTEARGNR